MYIRRHLEQIKRKHVEKNKNKEAELVQREMVADRETWLRIEWERFPPDQKPCEDQTMGKDETWNICENSQTQDKQVAATW